METKNYINTLRENKVANNSYETSKKRLNAHQFKLYALFI